MEPDPHLMEQGVVLVALVAIFAAVHFLRVKLLPHRQHHSHKVALLVMILCHPIALKTLEGFVAHLVFFSGYVLKLR